MRREAVHRAILASIARQRGSGEVLISDTTLRDGEQMPGVSFSSDDKVQIALALEEAGVHSIDAGFAAASAQELEAVRRVAAAVDRPVVMSLARTCTADIDRSREALRDRAPHRRGIGLFVGTSPLHREHRHGLSPAGILHLIEQSVQYASQWFDIVAVAAEDASRTEPDFLCECLQVAIRAGATSVGIPDTVGVLVPQMAADLVARVRAGVPSIDRALLAVHFHDDLGLAVANSLAAAEAGADVVQCTVGGIGERAGNAALEEVVLALVLHAERLGRSVGVDTRRMHQLCSLVANLSHVPITPNKAVVGSNVFATEAGIHQHGMLQDLRMYQPFPAEMVGASAGIQMIIGKHCGRRGLASRMAALGVELHSAELDALLTQIKRLPQPSDANDDSMLLRLSAELKAPISDRSAGG